MNESERRELSLLKDTDFDNKKIASLAGVAVAFVAKVRAELNP